MSAFLLLPYLVVFPAAQLYFLLPSEAADSDSDSDADSDSESDSESETDEDDEDES